MSPPSDELLESDLPGLTLLSRGKVRDIYALADTATLLFVATDRISAYDVVLRNVRAPPPPPRAAPMTRARRASPGRARC
jgi:hypothetical protein